MRAIRVEQFGPAEALKLVEAPDPVAGPGEVVVALRAAGVNPVDTYIRAGAYGALVTPPYTPGMDGAGVVEAIGPEVKKVRPGDRVYTAGTLSGSYAEKALCREAQVWPLPARVSFAQGAGLNVPYATAYRALFHRAGAQPGDTVLVHGASGGVGLAAVQLCRRAGLTSVGTAGSERGRKLVREQGADHVFDHRAANYLDEALAWTGGRGFDVILEMLANVNFGNDLPVLARDGRVVVIGSRGNVEINPRELMRRDASVLGLTLMNAGERELERIHAALRAGLEDGTLRPIVNRELPLAEAARAHELVLERGAAGKIVLSM